ncbi:MAG TPA: porin family protein [Bacteroidia bacterium]|jgi:hypothetical protein|nr:porin family protein [Bacteroidia bacterium]
MKIKLIVILSLISFSLFAQNSPYGAPPPPPEEGNMNDVWGERYFHFGLNFTPGIYWTVPNSSNNTANGASFGYGYGANLEFYFTRNYGLLTGIEVTDIDAKYINTTPMQGYYYDSIIKHNETVQYLQIPFELKLKTSPLGKMRFYGLVGLDFGFRLKATDDYTYTEYTNAVPPGFYFPPGNNVNISSQTDFFRVSLVIGGGVEYTLAGNTALQASLTYNNCFTNLNNTGSNAVNVKGVELMVGILF